MYSQAMRTNIGRLKAIGAIEAISFLVLLGIAMPLKYLAGMPEAVKLVGGIHGGLWVLYLAALLLAWREMRWSFGVFVLGVIASVVPFGPFVFDAKFLKKRLDLE